MKFIFKIMILFLVFLISLFIFLPKEGFYNLIEKEISKQNIIISDETKNSKTFGINIKNSEVYYDRINTAFIKDIDISTYFFYTSLVIDTIRVSKSFENMLPSKIKMIKIEHSILAFDKIDIKADGEFGKFQGKILLLERRIIGELNPSKIMKSKYRNILKQFKLVEGKYKYEFKF